MRSGFLKKLIALSFAVLVVLPLAASGTRNDDLLPVRHYYKMLDSLKTGWNTWDTRSMFTQLYLPEAFSVKLALVDAEGGIGAMSPSESRRSPFSALACTRCEH